MSDLQAFEARRQQLIDRYLPGGEAPAGEVSTGGVHHLALICSDIEATIRFYTEVLNMRLNRIIPNRDEPSSTHIFLDMGGGNQLAFFDFPQLGAEQTVRGVGSLHHIAIKAVPDQYQAIKRTLDARKIPYASHDSEGVGSMYLRDPDNILVEITTGR